MIEKYSFSHFFRIKALHLDFQAGEKISCTFLRSHQAKKNSVTTLKKQSAEIPQQNLNTAKAQIHRKSIRDGLKR